MKLSPSTHLILSNGAELPDNLIQHPEDKILRLEYEDNKFIEPNVKVSLLKFIRDLNHLPIRVRDLLEIAAYVFCADRSVFRGDKDLIEYHRWSRDFHFFIKVRDAVFWQRQDVQKALSAALIYMSGDSSYKFTFIEGRPRTITNLFDKEEFVIEPEHESKIVLFSGGLDSLAGIIDDLEKTQAHLYLISHRSGQPSTIKTQNELFNALKEIYENRVRHYKFHCSFKHIRGRDENQRTRAFLYTSIAYALSQALLQTNFTVYENGVTAMNFPKREDMGNARASRTTHPRTIRLLEKFYSLIGEYPISIETPFLWKTKTDVLKSLEDNRRPELISSAVSCSKTFQNTETTTHCGRCSQCIDRRLSSYAGELEDFDHPGLYTFDFITNEIEGETKTLTVDYVRHAAYFAEWSIDRFFQEMINDLVDIHDYIGLNEEEATQKVYDLHHRHGKEILDALRRIIRLNYDPTKKFTDGSFLQLISDHEYLKDPVVRLTEDICKRLGRAIPLMFQKNPPKNENDFNDKVSGILSSDSLDFKREHPSIPFAHAKSVPDHSRNGYDLLIEAKYLRDSTTPSVATEGISADLTKYPENSYLLFVVYDPHRAIPDDENFRNDFELKRRGRCTVFIVR